MSEPLRELLAIMRQLRAPGGCPWDRAQSFASIAPFTIEEAYEVADAIDRGHMPDLREELGDLLFQVVFHAQMAEEAGEFDFDAVAAAIRDKLVRRHPHVFDPAGAGARPADAHAQLAVWEDIKAAERAARAADAAQMAGAARLEDTARLTDAALHVPVASALDGVPVVLPALLRAFKLSRRAARVGFDFTHARECADKVAEELAEVREAADCEAAATAVGLEVGTEAGTPTAGTPLGAASAALFEEIGDLLFAAANLARKLEVDAEAALRAANRKFERRFRGMERLAAQRGEDFGTLSLAAQEALWQEVKRAE